MAVEVGMDHDKSKDIGLPDATTDTHSKKSIGQRAYRRPAAIVGAVLLTVVTGLVLLPVVSFLVWPANYHQDGFGQWELIAGGVPLVGAAAGGLTGWLMRRSFFASYIGLMGGTLCATSLLLLWGFYQVMRTLENF